MSKFSGKSDFADTCLMHYTPNRIFYDAKIYTNNGDRIHFESPKDLIPYYPYLIGSMAGSKEGSMTITLSKESFNDDEERDRIFWVIDDAIRYLKKCKSKKKVPNFEEFKKEVISIFDDKVLKYIFKNVDTDMFKKHWYPGFGNTIEYQTNLAVFNSSPALSRVHTRVHTAYRESLLSEASKYFGKFWVDAIHMSDNDFAYTEYDNFEMNNILWHTLLQVRDYYRLNKELGD